MVRVKDRTEKSHEWFGVLVDRFSRDLASGQKPESRSGEMSGALQEKSPLIVHLRDNCRRLVQIMNKN